MEQIKEVIFGDKQPVSATILALKTGTHISQARTDLELFYQAHQDKLHAAYLEQSIEGQKRVFRIVDASNRSPDAQIYYISLTPALDPVILAQVDHEKQLLAAQLSSAQLSHTGRVLNPLAYDATTGADPTGHTAREEPPNKKQALEETVEQVPMPASKDVDMSEDEDIVLPSNMGQPGRTSQPSSKPQPLPEPQAKPQSPPKPAAAPIKPIKLPKIPSQPKQKKQASLASFFSKRN